MQVARLRSYKSHGMSLAPQSVSTDDGKSLKINIGRPTDPHIARTVFHGRSNDIWHAGSLCRSPGFGSSIVGLDHRSWAAPVTGWSLVNGIMRPNGRHVARTVFHEHSSGI